MDMVEYSMEDVFRCYGGEPPESVFKYADIGGNVWCNKVQDEYVVKGTPSGKLYFKAFLYSYPFAEMCDFREMLKKDFKFSLYNGKTSGFVLPVRSLLRAVKHLNKGSISFRMGCSGDEYVSKALADIVHIDFLVKKEDKDYSLTAFTLECLCHVLTKLRLCIADEPPILAEASSEEAFETVEYCRDVLLGMLSSRLAVLPLPENLEKQK